MRWLLCAALLLAGCDHGTTVVIVSIPDGAGPARPAAEQILIVVPYDLPRGCAATYFPEANVLVPLDSIADKSHTPTSKSVVIRIRSRSGR